MLSIIVCEALFLSDPFAPPAKKKRLPDFGLGGRGQHSKMLDAI